MTLLVILVVLAVLFGVGALVEGLTWALACAPGQRGSSGAPPESQEER